MLSAIKYQLCLSLSYNHRYVESTERQTMSTCGLPYLLNPDNEIELYCQGTHEVSVQLSKDGKVNGCGSMFSEHDAKSV